MKLNEDIREYEGKLYRMLVEGELIKTGDVFGEHGRPLLKTGIQTESRETLHDWCAGSYYREIPDLEIQKIRKDVNRPRCRRLEIGETIREGDWFGFSFPGSLMSALAGENIGTEVGSSFAERFAWRTIEHRAHTVTVDVEINVIPTIQNVQISGVVSTAKEIEFWKRAFLVRARRGYGAPNAAIFADEAVQELRKRVQLVGTQIPPHERTGRDSR